MENNINQLINQLEKNPTSDNLIDLLLEIIEKGEDKSYVHYAEKYYHLLDDSIMIDFLMDAYIGTDQFLKALKISKKLQTLYANNKNVVSYYLYKDGNIHTALNEPDQAIFAYDNAIKLFPHNYFAFSGLAYYYEMIKNYDNAIYNLKQALHHFNYLEKKELTFTTILLTNDEMQPSEAELESVLKEEALEKQNIIFNLAFVYSKAGKFKDAIETYESMLTIPDVHVHYPFLLNNLAYEYYASGDNPKAISAYKHSLTIHSKRINVIGMNVRGIINCYKKLGKHDDAISILNKYKDISTLKSYISKTMPRLLAKNKQAVEDKEVIETVINRENPTTQFSNNIFFKNSHQVSFSKEKLLENNIVEDINKGLFFDLDLYQHTDGRNGQQFQTNGHGIIDLLCINKAKNKLIVVELKRNEAGEEVVTQIQRYMNYVSKEIAPPGLSVEGYIILNNPNNNLKEKVTNFDNIKLYIYNRSINYQQV